MAMLEAEEKKLRERLRAIDEMKDSGTHDEAGDILNCANRIPSEQDTALQPAIEASNPVGNVEGYERVRDESQEEQVYCESEDEFEDAHSIIRSSIIGSTRSAAATDLRSFTESQQSASRNFRSYHETEEEMWADYDEDIATTPRNSIIDSHLEARRRSLLEERTNHLPDEIILEITAYVARGACSQQALATCCLLSRKW